MPGYDTLTRTLRLGGLDYRIRSLADLQQFADPDNHAQLLGISSAPLSVFGHVCPAGRLLAAAMATHDVVGTGQEESTSASPSLMSTTYAAFYLKPHKQHQIY